MDGNALVLVNFVLGESTKRLVSQESIIYSTVMHSMPKQCKCLHICMNTLADRYYEGMLNSGWDCDNGLVALPRSCLNRA